MTVERNGVRERLIVPVAAALTVMWMSAGFDALFTGRTEVFFIATAPFGALVGYLFGQEIVGRVVGRAPRNGETKP